MITVKKYSNNSKDVYYVAFLRGINIGGNVIVKMSELKEEFESLGFVNVETVLNSGNVIFSTSKKELVPRLVTKIEKALFTKFKRDIHVIIRSGDEIKEMIKKNPFKKVVMSANTRRYVTFLSGVPENKKADVFTLIEIDEKNNTVDLMADVMKKYGKNITTRNWNTIERIEKLLAEK